MAEAKYSAPYSHDGCGCIRDANGEYVTDLTDLNDGAPALLAAAQRIHAMWDALFPVAVFASDQQVLWEDIEFGAMNDIRAAITKALGSANHG